MDVKYINPFITAASTVFKTMLNLETSMEKPFLKNDKTSSGDVTGVIGLAGDKSGSVCVSFREKGALLVYKTLMGDECTEISPDVVDAIGELTNIIAGQARKELEHTGVNLKASIPTIVVGRGSELHMLSESPMISLPFSFEVDNTREIMHVDFTFG
jgi:chemotaxis protein CheX